METHVHETHVHETHVHETHVTDVCLMPIRNDFISRSITIIKVTCYLVCMSWFIFVKKAHDCLFIASILQMIARNFLRFSLCVFICQVF